MYFSLVFAFAMTASEVTIDHVEANPAHDKSLHINGDYAIRIWNRHHHDGSYLQSQLAQIARDVEYVLLQMQDAIEMMKTYVTEASLLSPPNVADVADVAFTARRASPPPPGCACQEHATAADAEAHCDWWYMTQVVECGSAEFAGQGFMQKGFCDQAGRAFGTAAGGYQVNGDLDDVAAATVGHCLYIQADALHFYANPNDTEHVARGHLCGTSYVTCYCRASSPPPCWVVFGGANAYETCVCAPPPSPLAPGAPR
jgi:hypothetical protein